MYEISEIKYILIHSQFCNECQQYFSDRANRNRHIRTQHRQIVRKFQCLNCPKVYSTKYALSKHSMEQHAGSIEFEIILLGKIKFCHLRKYFFFFWFSILFITENPKPDRNIEKIAWIEGYFEEWSLCQMYKCTYIWLH